SDKQVNRFYHEPPNETRAYLRAHVLRRFGEHVSDVDWEDIRFRLPGESYWYSQAILEMPDPTAFGREQSEELLSRCSDLRELIVAIGGERALESGWSRKWGKQSIGTGLSRWW